ncbi:Golgi transport complex subunit 6 [Dinochytrium kinnereticum]|nr:Golgi transport complex subunit 6 [Dinochytrium kinnereticum]
MRTINALLVDSTLSVRGQMLAKTEVENEAYLYKTNLEELKNELQVLRQNETGSLKNDVDTIMRNLENLNQKLAERISALKSDVSMDINNHKTEARDIGTSTDLKIQEIHHKLVIKISNLKTKMETVKMDITRNIVWTALFTFGFILSTEFLTQPPSPPKASSSSSSILSRTNPLSKKLSKVLHTSVDDSPTQDGLKVLSDFYTVNTPAARRNLRTDIDHRVGHFNNKFLEAYDEVTKNLSKLHDAVSLLNECCSEMEEKLALANDQTAELVKHTHEMNLKSQKILTRKVIAETFITRFTPTDSEIAILTSSSLNVGTEFFNALRRVLEISDDCKALLITDNQQAGLEIMEKISQYLEIAYDKLFRWAQGECRFMSKEVPEVSAGMKDAIRALRQRPVLFQTCVDEISHIRQGAIARAFLEALTQGGPNGVPRPIEIHAHDPLRYIGDMLGWLHQTSVSERDLVEGIIGVRNDSGETLKKAPIRPQMNSADIDTLFAILDKNLEKTCRPFKMRVEQVLISQPGAITSYRIANTMQFYAFTISQVIGKDSRLTETVREMSETAFKVFLENLRQYGAKIQASKEAPGRDLLPPPIVKESVLQLKELMSSYEANLLENDGNSYDFGEVLTVLIDPVLELSRNGASTLPALEGCIYQLNCCYIIKASMLPYSFTKDRLHMVESDMKSFRDTLVKETYNLLLQQSGLFSVIKTLEKNIEQVPYNSKTSLKPRLHKVPLSLVAGIDQRTISEAMSRLDAFLRDIGFDVTSRLSRMLSSQDTKHVIDSSLRAFADSYATLYEKVIDPANKYEFPATLMTRSIDEIETLLDIPKAE